MGTGKLTDKIVHGLVVPAPGCQTFARDNVVTGLAARKTASGHTAFVFNYVCRGTQRRLTIGEYPAWSVAAAREEAKRLRRMVDTGDDPLEARKAEREELTLAALWERYAELVLPSKAAATQRDVRSIWDRIILPELGRRKLSSIDTQAIERLHRNVSVKTPTQANRCLATVSHVFTKAVRWGHVGTNPVRGIERNPEQPRCRYLTESERVRFLAVLDRAADTASSLAVRFLLLTGARSGEVFKATWDQFDLTNAVWTKPSATTKQRRLHRVPLSSAAMEVLLRARRLSSGDVVFDRGSGKPLTTIKKFFDRIRTEADLYDFRLHDLRHSFASFLVADGASLPIVGRLLGHTQVATTNRYAHLEDEPLRQATDRLARRVLE